MYRRQIDPNCSRRLPILPPLLPITRHARQTIGEQFEAFHAANPHVYRRLREMAFELARGGQKRIGIKMLWRCCAGAACVPASLRGESDYDWTTGSRPGMPVC